MLLLVARPKYGHKEVDIPHLEPHRKVQRVIPAESVELLISQVLYRLALCKSLAFPFRRVIHDRLKSLLLKSKDLLTQKVVDALIHKSQQLSQVAMQHD